VVSDLAADAMTARDRAAADAALARCVGDPVAFLAGPHGSRPHLRRAGAPFDDLLSLAGVDEALTGRGLRYPAVRAVDRHLFTRTARSGRARLDDLVDAGRLLELFADGATVVLQALQRWWPPITAFCRDLEVALGHPVQANAYLTPPGAAGLAPHHDTHDVFVLQVAGSKRWTLREPVLEAPLARHPSDHDTAAAQPVLLEAELRPGDALYLPRGVVHSAAAQQGLSLHLTVGVLATTAHDVVRRVLDRAADEVTFRRDLPPGYAFDRDVARKAVADVVQQLGTWLDHLDTAEVADGLVESFLTRRSPLLGGHLLELASVATVDDRTVVRRRPGTLSTITPAAAGTATPASAAAATTDEHEDQDGDSDGGEPGDGRGGVRPEVRVTLGDREVRLPAALEPVVRRLLDGEPHAVADLGDLLDQPSRAVLVRRLVREGALVTEEKPGATAGPGPRRGRGG
jgi:hypothetical protein